MADTDTDAPRPPPQAWLDAIEESEADLAAGRTVDARAFLAELRAEDAARQGTKTARTETSGEKLP